jgi:hypothetical protein
MELREPYMRRFSFGNMLVDDANREAVQVCRDIAERRPVAPQPVLLVGAPGSGKTHLLYAIVDHVRKAYEPGETKYAILNPRKLPAEVRAQVRGLVREPEPVRSAQHALLLVDQLEAYTEETDELEALVRVFLDSGHPVVLASDVAPERLGLSERFRDLIAKGRTVGVAPVANVPGELEQRVRQTHAEDAEQQRRELETQRALAEAAQETAQWRQRTEAIQTEAADLRTQVQVARAMSKSLERQLEDMRVALYEARSAPAPDEPLRAELAQAKTATEQHAEEVRRLKETLAQREASAAADGDALRTELMSVRRMLEAAELRAETAERSQHETSASRDRLAMEQSRLEGELLTLREELARETARVQGSEEEKAEFLHERLRLENDMRALREQLDAAGAAAQAGTEERNRLLTRVETLEAECATLKARLEEEQERVHGVVEQERRAAQAQFEAHREVTARSDEEARARIVALEAEVLEARGQGDELRATVENLTERARRLVEQIDANRLRFSEIETEQLRRIEELERALEEHAVAVASAEELAAVRSRAEEAVAQLDSLQSRFETERTQLQDGLREARERMETDAARREEELRRATEERDALRTERDVLAEELRGTSERTAVEVESLRREAHEQSQNAAARIRELEDRVEAAQREAEQRAAASTARARETAELFAAARGDLAEQLEGVNEILSGAAGLLRRATDSWNSIDAPDPGELIRSVSPDTEPPVVEGSNSPSETSLPETQRLAQQDAESAAPGPVSTEQEDDWASETGSK